MKSSSRMRIFVFATVCCASAFVGSGATFQEITRNMTLEEKEEYQRTIQERRQRRTGGTLIDRRQMTGCVVFLNAQGRVKAAALEEIPRKLSGMFKREIVLVERCAPVCLAEMNKTAKGVGAECVIVITDTIDVPTLLIAPEAGWAAVNIAPLADDDEKKFARRVRREVMRAFGFLCGADSMNRGSVLESVTNVADLDELTGETLGQDAVIVIDKHLSAIGVKPYSESTYKQACYEGWAPAPTNDIQRVIWEKIKAEQSEQPTKPLKITPDMKPQGK